MTTKKLQTFYQGKKVLVTGIHGFKGCWLALLLKELGAEVVGVGLKAEDNLLFDILDFDELGIKSTVLDIRDPKFIAFVTEVNADVVFHLAAQPIVSVGYSDPYLTYSTNVMGTVNLLEGIRLQLSFCSVVNVTTDKVYMDANKSEPYVETDTLMGLDPYSSSKSCSELVTFSYVKSYFQQEGHKIVSTCRAGNVIGGGDFSLDRIIPDMARALKAGAFVRIRNYDSTRPYQHVLDAVYGYALLGCVQYSEPNTAGSYNIGPDTETILQTRDLVGFFQEKAPLKVIDESAASSFHETKFLTLDSSKFRTTFGWRPTWGNKNAMLERTFSWYDEWMEGSNMRAYTQRQVREFLDD
jgi:CDP-glucose 4,6-dehydratase